MKRALIVAACTLAFSASAEPLSREDIARQLTYTMLHVADWNQTRRIARNPHLWHEKNIVLGRHPRQVEVNRYFATTLAAHWLVTAALPAEWRAPWQGVTIALQASVVRRNYRLGISASF